MTPRAFRTLAPCLLAVVAACPAPKDPTPPGPTLTVSPTTAAIAPGDAPLTFTATLTDSTATVAWSVIAGSCASPGMVGATTGVYTPPATNDVACTCTVRATAGALSADATISVSARSAGGDTLTVTPTAGRVRAGSSTPLTIFVDASDAATAPSCTLAPALGSCVEAADPGGHTHAFEVTAPSTLVTATAAVEATVTVGTLSARVAVTVDPSILVVSGPTVVRAGGAIATYAVIAPATGAETVAWSLFPGAGSISAGGLYTPPATQVVTSFDVVATIGEARGTLTVTLEPSSTVGTASDGFLELAAAINGRVAECLGSTGLPAGELDAAAASIQAAVDAGKVVYDPSQQADCLASIDGTTCLEILHGAEVTGCIEDAYGGTVPEGGECGDSVECAAGYCSFAAGTCPGGCAPPVAPGSACEQDEQCATGLSCLYGTCRAPTMVADGASCNDVTYVCAPWSYCKGGTCAAHEVVGAACTSFDACSPSLTCAFPPGTYANGSCATYAARGQPCGGTVACNVFTDYCGAGGTCVPWPVLGESCAVALECRGEAWCDDTLVVPTCVAYPGPGEECFLAGGCAGENYCDYGGTTPLCAPKKSSGACWYPGECVASMYCTGTLTSAGTCVPRIAAGGTCTAGTWDDGCQDGLDCVGGICSVGTCY